LKDFILDCVSKLSEGADVIVHLVRNKAIERQFHTYFQWRERNANAFFGIFGTDFRDFMQKRVKTDSKLDDGIKKFLELGNLRNEMVHENSATFGVEKTLEELYVLYKDGRYFIDQFRMAFLEYCGIREDSPDSGGN
jgi:hypothetical protein